MRCKKIAFGVIAVTVVACMIPAICLIIRPKQDFSVIRVEEVNENIINTYICEEPGVGGTFSLTISEDGSFNYYEGILSSYLGYGTWQLNDGKLVLSDIGSGEVRKTVFAYHNGELFYNSSESDGFTYVSLSDGTKFIPENKITAELLAELDLKLAEQEQQRMEAVKWADDEFEQQKTEKLATVVKDVFIGKDMIGNLCFDASQAVKDSLTPINLWIEDEQENVLWDAELALLQTAWNSYYLYEEDGRNYLIHYYLEDSQDNIELIFKMFTIDHTGKEIEKCYFQAYTQEELHDINSNVKTYLMNSLLVIGTKGDDIAIVY